MASIEQIAADIKKAYERVGKQDWTKMTEVAEVMHLDASVDQFAQAVRHLIKTDPDCEVMTEINQKTLTPMDRLYRVMWAGDLNDLIKF